MKVWSIGLSVALLGGVSTVLMAGRGGVAGAQPIQISEIRIDQPSTDNDEYFELAGPPSGSLTGLTYVTIGDSPAAFSGVIENVTSLDGLTLDANGFFVAAESTFSLGTADLTTTLAFENSDNVTHLLVMGFTGAADQDLDTNDDGELDITPWTSVVDALGLVEKPPPDYVYGAFLGFEDIGPDGTFVPGQVYRCDPNGLWTIGDFTTGISDTPGAVNLMCNLGPDTDGDGVPDSIDNCVLFNPDQADCNENGVGDVCDVNPADPDGDGMVFPDCDGNQSPDSCDPDCNMNMIPDFCDIVINMTSDDVNGDLIPDECQQPGALVINEIHADPDPMLGDANGDAIVDFSDDEFVEIVNNSGADFDLSDYGLSDGFTVRHVFPAGTIVPDQCSIVVFGGGNPAEALFGGSLSQVASTGALGLNNGGDTVTVLLPDLMTQDTAVTYGAEGGMNQSLTRDPDITGLPPLVLHTTATGSGGALYSPGLIMIDQMPFPGCGPPPPDADGDGQPDSEDNCPLFNPDQADCNGNGVGDVCDIDPSDPDGDGIVFDDCDMDGNPDVLDGICEQDCNGNLIPDDCDIDPADPDGNGMTSSDCNANGIPDECETDCNMNGVPDDCDVDPTDPDGNMMVSADCNANGVPDECDPDCNNNGVPDECDVDPTDPDGNGMTSTDCNSNGIPDECEDDCDDSGTPDDCDIANNPGLDANGNLIIDTCEITPPAGLRLNEIRIDQGGTDNDEYFEIKGMPGTSLDGLKYVVLGDTPGSGAVEAVVDLDGLVIPADGHFLAVEDTFTLVPLIDADLVLVPNMMNFENGDTVTHLLVANTGVTVGTDLDTDDDGVIDVMPWAAGDQLDCVAVLDDPPPFMPPLGPGDEFPYCLTTVGPVVGAGFTEAPSHVYQCEPDRTWEIGQDVPTPLIDTPGTENVACGGGTCIGDVNMDGNVDTVDLLALLGAWGTPDPAADFNMSGSVDTVDLLALLGAWGPCP